MKRMLLDATSDTPVQIELLAHYCTMVMTDPIIGAHCNADERFSVGLKFVPTEVTKLVYQLLCLLADQLNEEQFCRISKDRILDIGAVINEIWAVVEDNKGLR